MQDRKIRCLLIRHGKTAGNLEKRYIGAGSDETLCAPGIAELTDFWQGRSVTVGRLYCSPMLRCKQTAEIVFADYCKTEKIRVLEDLREIDFGDFEGKNYEELSDNPEYQKWIDSGGSLPFPKGEAREAFIRRSVAAFLETLSTDNTSDHYTFVCHGGSIMAIMSHLTGGDYFDFQVPCGDGYEIELCIGEGIHVLSFDRIFNRSGA